MVPNIQIASLVLASLPLCFDVTQGQAQIVAAQFRDFAARAGTANYVGAPPSADLLTPAEDILLPVTSWFFWSAEGIIGVTKLTGRVSRFSQRVHDGFAEEWNEQAALSTASLQSFANLYFAQAGYQGELLTVRVAEKEHGSADTASLWNYACIRKLSSDIQYHQDYDVMFMVEHVSGRLSLMNVPPLPTPPSDTVAEISSSQALASGALMLAQTQNISSFSILQSVRKVVWSPKDENLSAGMRFLTAYERQVGEAFRGKMVYWAELRSEEPGISARFWVFVEPRTGRAMGGTKIGGGFGGPLVGPQRPVTPESIKGIVSVVTKGRVVRTADVSLKPTKTTGRVDYTGITFIHERTVIVGAFDSKSGLVFVGKKWFKPNNSLVTAIRRSLNK
jgi:hypothetical protein